MNYVLYLRFGLLFKMATSMSDFGKASDLFGINKFEEIEEYFIVTCDFIGGILVSPASCIFIKTRFC